VDEVAGRGYVDTDRLFVTGGSGGGSNTPPGTYTIPVTVTSLGITHSLNVTLTVD